MHQRMKDMDTKLESSRKAASKSRVGIDDFYWLAVPIHELAEYTNVLADACGAASIEEIRNCAFLTVRSKLCDCAQQEESVVEAVMQEFTRLVKRRKRTMSSENNSNSSDFPAAKAVDLADMVEYQSGSVVSRTILKKESGTLTLFAFDVGQSLSEHTAPFNAYVQVLDGEVELIIDGESIKANKGKTVLMPADIPHAVHAHEQFKMLLTMIKEK